jgi:hypothetical protein
MFNTCRIDFIEVVEPFAGSGDLSTANFNKCKLKCKLN